MKIVCVGYREWALRIYDQLLDKTSHDFLVFRSKSEYDEKQLRDFKPDMVLFFGWSWYVASDIVDDFSCVMLHPSPLPKYRGGSPLQNQIIRGETDSAVTLFLMDDGLDSGPILAQAPLSLRGNMHEIFDRMVETGTALMLDILSKGMDPVPQNHEEATSYPRRKPEESEITQDELNEQSATYLYNKIRMLQWPYPNAFIRTQDGKKLVIVQAEEAH